MNLNGCLNNLFIIVFEVWKLVNQVITDINFTDRYTLTPWRCYTKASLCSRQRDTNYFGPIFLSNLKDFTNADLT